ncbi:condensation domain-containing protein [Streptomyces sp. NPDC090442]|uniref:phthiocerol/phthiodiolone dimycocerosyl transferase family protein n=1 Tax=Streptomyces sp. NPDC090442 TaxID=3365962 RepID=UPI00382A38DD
MTSTSAGSTSAAGAPARDQSVRPRLRRPLSPLERWYWIADQISPLNGIARARVHGLLPVQVLRRALDVLQDRHPLLRVAISSEPDGTRAEFVPVEGQPVPLRLAVADAEDQTAWEREVNEHELVTGVDWRTGPLLRAVVISQRTEESATPDDAPAHDLLLVASHCVADGLTLLSLLRQWIEIAAELHAGRTVLAPPFRALPATEDLVPERHRGVEGSARLAALMLRDTLASRRLRAQRIVPGRAVPAEERRTQMLHRTLTGAQMELVTRACKRQGTTVHGALAAALVTAVAKDAGTCSPAHFSIGSPVDFRSSLSGAISREEAGSYAATLPSLVAYRPGRPLWPMARSISKDLARRRARGEHLTLVKLLGSAGPASVENSGPFVRFMDEKGPINLCLSNVGRHDFPARLGPWAVSDAQLVAGISVTGSMVATAITAHGQLAWNFSYVPGTISPLRAQGLADDCVRTVLTAAASAAG